MSKSDRIKRWVVFYFSVALFFILLPIVLSYSLGYHMDLSVFKIYKTGIIYLKTQPDGASVYINGKLVPDLTPAKIEEMKPGRYMVEVRKERFYPWQKELDVKPNMVTKAEEIVLFPISQDINRISGHEVGDFAVSDKNVIYYMTDIGLYRSNMDGTNLKKISSYSGWPKGMTKKIFSPDGDKLLYFNEDRIWVIYLKPDNAEEDALAVPSARIEEVLNSQEPIKNVFWYSQSNYIVFVTEKEINVVEPGGQAPRNNIVTLHKFNARPNNIFYDTNHDSLYFIDNGIGSDPKNKNYLYRMDLRKRFFDQFMGIFFKKEPEIRYEKR